MLLAPASGAQAQSERARVKLVEVRGLLDPVLVDFLASALDAAPEQGLAVLVIQLDSPGAVVSERRMAALRERISRSTVPVAVWVGPSGARAGGAAAGLVRAAAVSGTAPGTRIAGVKAARAVASGLVDLSAPVLGDFVVALDGRRVGGRTIDTAEVVRTPEGPRLRPYGILFTKLGLLEQLLHTVASPSVAYILLLAGLGLVVFELFTAGIGVAAAVAAGCLALAGYGLGVLPTRPLGLALLALAALGFAIDVQTGVPRFWTGAAVVGLVLGSVLLYDDRRVPLFTMVVMVSLLVTLMVAGMPGVVRSRFATPTIGRESMIGNVGRAAAAIDPDGIVVIRGAQWRARTNRATPVAAGDEIRVVSVDGLVLEVEPLEGAAKDAHH